MHTAPISLESFSGEERVQGLTSELAVGSKMPIKYTFENASNVTLKSCEDFGTVFWDGFRDNDVLIWPHDPVLKPNSIASEDTRQARLQEIGRYVAPEYFLKVLSGQYVLCSAYDGHECVATSLFKLPSTQCIELSKWEALKFYYYKVFYWLASLFRRPITLPYDLPAVQKFMHTMYDEATGPSGPEYYKTLSLMSYNDLRYARYPKDDTLYINILSVRQGQQGRKLGSLLIEASLPKFNLGDMVFRCGKHVSKGPAKTATFPTTGKEGFYNRLGYEAVYRYHDVHPHGGMVEHVFMQRLLLQNR